MGFADAVRSCLDQYVGFSGRARRSEYWFFALFNVVVGAVTLALDAALGLGFLNLLASLALLLPSLAVGVRRLHDTDRSGAWLLIALVPLVGAIVLLVFFVQEGTRGQNRYGADPKQHAGVAGQYA